MKKTANLLRMVIFLSLLLIPAGCKTAPKAPSTPAMIEINTTPTGAEVYVEGKYLGKSPVFIQAPKEYRGKESIKVEARLKGYENKIFLLGEYYPPRDKFIIGAGTGTGNVSIFGSKSIARTTGGYYKFPESVNIELAPK